VTTWDPANSPNATLTGGNLVATFNSSSFSNGALSNTSKSSGKFVFDVGIVCSNPSDNAIGITQGAPPGAYYDSPTSWLFVPQSGYSMVRNNGSAVATEFTAPPPTSPYTLRVYVDLTALKVYFSVGGVYYFGGDASAGTGGLTIPSGAFYVNGFSTAGGDALTLNPSPTGLPAGWSAWDAPPRIDGKDHTTGFSGTTRTLTLTTTQANDYIIVAAVTNSDGIASVTGSSLGSFTLIQSAARGGTSSLQVWAKFAASPLTSEVITVTQNDSNFMTCDAFAVAGTGQTSLVWSTGSPQKVDNASTSVSITTTEAKSVVIGAHAVNDNGVTPASGYTLIYGSDYALTQYKELSAAGTETISGGSSTLQASIAVAIPIAVVGGGATLTAAGLTNTSPVFGAPTLAIPAPLVLYDYTLDFGLNAFLLANKIVVCSQKPTTYTEANSTYKIGEKTFAGGGAGFAIDGSIHGNNTGGTTSVTLTTTQSNDYIIVTILSNGGPVTGVSGSSLGAFTRIAFTNTGQLANVSEIWAKFSPAALTSEVITVTMTSSNYTTVDAFGVSGSNQTSLAWDAGSPVTSIWPGTTNPLSITTTTPDTMVIGHFYMPSNDTAFSPGTGYTFIGNGDFSSTEYQVFTSAGAKTVDVSVTVVGASCAVAIPKAAGGGVVTAGPQDATPTGRQIVTAAVTGGTVTTNGTPTNWAIVDDANSRLLAAGDMTGSVAVTTADSWTLDAMTINVP
jgi:hypothetical protein